MRWDFEASTKCERGEVVEGDILCRGAEVQRETVFRAAATADDDAAEFDIEPLDAPSRRGRVGADGHPFFCGLHVGEEILADVENGMQHRDILQFLRKNPCEGELDKHAA